MRSLTTLAAFVALGVSALAAPPVPRPAKEFDFDVAGKHILLSSLKGKVVIVQGLLVTCPHCQAMSALLTKLQGDYGPRGFQAMGVAYDVGSAEAQNYVAQYHVGFPVGFATRDTFINFLGHSVMDRLMFPQELVIDRKGIIQAESASTGTAELQEEASLRVWIEKLLGPATSKTRTKSGPTASAKKAAATTASTQ